MTSLTPCAACARHVRTNEPACPFCGNAVSTPSRRAAPEGRLARSALCAFAVLGLAACGGAGPEPVSPEPPPPVPATNPGGPTIEPPGTTMPAAAPQPPPEQTMAAPSPPASPPPSSAMAAAYGAPPRPESPVAAPPAPAPAAEKGKVEITAVNVKGGTVDNATQAAETMRAAFARCYSKGLAADPGASGQVTLTVRVGLAGQVLGVSVQRTDKVPAQVASCMTVRAGSAEFSPPKGAKKEVALDMTVNLTP